MTKGLIVFIYKAGHGDTTNNGISSRLWKAMVHEFPASGPPNIRLELKYYYTCSIILFQEKIRIKKALPNRLGRGIRT